jgi:hypothetical protein
MDMVESALDSLERGDFRDAGRLADAVLADEEVLSLSGLRTGTATGLPFHFEPEPAGILMDWKHMLPVHIQDDVLYKALMLGWCLVHDRRQSYDELPCWRTWPSEAVRFDTWRGVWQVETADRGLLDISPGDGQWALFEQRFARPWMAAYLRALAPMVIIRQSTLFNWANHAQVYATPSRILKSPSRMAELQDVQRAVQLLRKLVGDSTICLPEGLSMELLELKELTYQIYLHLRKSIDDALQIMWVGQLGTAKAAGGWGSAHTERRVTQQILERDVRILQDTAHRQILAPYDFWKRGTRELARVPMPCWDTVPPPDRTAEAQRDLTEAQAHYQRALELKVLAGLDFGGGWRVNMRRVCTERGIPLEQRPAQEESP